MKRHTGKSGVRGPHAGGRPSPLEMERLTGLSNRALHLILLPTEACNFRCRYCYESFAYKRMERAVVSGVKNWISRRAPDLDELSLSWFGGEPLLAVDLIEEIQSHARKTVRRNPGIDFASDMTTNGYLLGPAVFSRLAGVGMSDYQISFDGPREYHDRKRVLAGGKGTFDRIWSNLLAMHRSETPFRIVVRVHVDRENEGAIPAFLEQVAGELEGDERFELFIRTLSRLGGPNDADLPVLPPDDGRRAVEALRALARGRGLRQLEMRPQAEICYAAKGNSFVVRSNGRINKCTVAMEHPLNQIGSIREDGTLAIEGEKLWPWMRGLRTGDPAALKCPMVGLADSVPNKAAPIGRTIPLAPASRSL